MTETPSLDEVMSRRFQLVEDIAIIQGRQKLELEPLNEEVRLCETFIKDEMNKGNMQQWKSSSTGHMAFFQTKDSVKVDDWDEVLAYIREHEAYYLLNHAVGKQAVKEFIEANKSAPPGVEYTSFKDLAWRRGKG